MIFFEESVLLKDAHISTLVDNACESCAKALGKKMGNSAKLRLSLEELLLRFQENYPEDTPCKIRGRKLLGRTYFELSQPGPENDILAVEDELQSTYDILARLEVYPKYDFRARKGGVNRVMLPVETKKKKGSSFLSIGIAVLLAIAVFVAFNFAPDAARTMFFDGIISPVFSKLIGVLTGVATVFVFMSVITGIMGIGDASSFGKVGKKYCLSMGSTYLLAAVVLMVMGTLFFGVNLQVGSGGGDATGDIMALVLDIIPSNMVEPFATDNALQVIVIAVFFGALILVLGDKISSLNKVVFDLADLMNLAMTTILKALPLIVFFGVLNMLYTVDLESMVSIWLMLIAFLVGSFIVVGIEMLRVCKTTGISLPVLIKCQLPAFLINLATASQISAMSEHMICCKEKFGIDSKFADFAIPLGIVIFMPCGAVFIGLTAWSCFAAAGAMLSIDAAIKIALISVIVAIAAPPIPGAALAVLPIVFTSGGVPMEMMPLAIIIGTVIGYVLPAFNGLDIQLQVLLSAYKMGKLDKETFAKLL